MTTQHTDRELLTKARKLMAQGQYTDARALLDKMQNQLVAVKAWLLTIEHEVAHAIDRADAEIGKAKQL